MTKEARIYNGVKTVYSINGVEKKYTEICKKMKQDYLLTRHTGRNSK